MNGFVLHPEAYTDLEEIWEYIAADSLDTADRICEEIYETIRSLVVFPYIGHNRPDLTARPLRFQSLREYVIAYATMRNRSPLSLCCTDAATHA
jgi:plasmid stabilization system protein ParE